MTTCIVNLVTLAAMLACCGLGIESAAAARPDPTTLAGKLIMGYQGWFACPTDSNAGHRWVHWFAGPHATVDMLPDVSEVPPSDRCPSPLTAADGHAVQLFSSQDPATVDLHFAWMQQYGIDGVALQRFAVALRQPRTLELVNTVLRNVRAAAERHGRVFFLTYDVAAMPPPELLKVAADWQRLEAQGLTRSPVYLHHRGRPLLGIWGLGFPNRPMTAGDADALLTALRRASEPYGGVTIMGGVPVNWRNADGGWQRVWSHLTVISPWTVGDYRDDAGIDTYRETHLLPDLAAAARLRIDYMPVIFPGFTWANLMHARHRPDKAITNVIPRRCGRFYWRQVYDAVSAGAAMLYNAMFDEVDEGTAMFKIVPDAADAPAPDSFDQDRFVTLDADGCRVPSDWYLRLAGAATLVLKRKLPLSPQMPLTAPQP